ncbi:hypothetical protein SBADM41S_01740 [Streptomyces badius]
MLVVAHNTLLRIARCDLLGLPLGRYRRIFPRLDNGAVTEIEIRGMVDGAALAERPHSAAPRPRARSEPCGRLSPMTKRSAEERRRLIADHVVEQGTATGAALAQLTGVSLMTVHRDLDDLARREGVSRRFRGGASALPSTVFESSLDYRLGVNRAEKKAVARAAAALVEPACR